MNSGTLRAAEQPEGSVERFSRRRDRTSRHAAFGAARFGAVRYKELGYDLWLLKTDRKKLRAKYVARYGEARGEQVVEMLIQKLVKIGLSLIKDHEYRVSVDPELREIYSNSMAFVENQGHTFGEDLSAQDKKALAAFLATL